MLVKCHSCGKEISSEAKTCPHCGEPDPYTDVDARLDSAIHKKVEKQMSRETIITIVVIAIGVLWGWVQGGGLWAFLGFIIGAIFSQVIIKVMGWFN